MKNPTLGSDGLVELRGGTAIEQHRIASKSSNQITKEMNLQEIVEEQEKYKEKAKQKVRDGN